MTPQTSVDGASIRVLLYVCRGRWRWGFRSQLSFGGVGAGSRTSRRDGVNASKPTKAGSVYSPPEANMRCVQTVSEGGLDWPSRDRWRAASCRTSASRCRVGQEEAGYLLQRARESWTGLYRVFVKRNVVDGHAMPPGYLLRRYFDEKPAASMCGRLDVWDACTGSLARHEGGQ